MTTSQSFAWLIAAPQEYGSEVRRTSPSSMSPRSSPGSRNRQAELTDDHLSFRVPDQRELVVLLADARRERGPEQHLVHLVSGVAKGVLDQVQCHHVDIDAAKGLGRGLEEACHGLVLRVRVEGTDEEAATRMHRRGVPGKDQRGGVHLRHDGWTAYDVAGLELGAVETFASTSPPSTQIACVVRCAAGGSSPPFSSSIDVTSGRGPLAVARTVTSSCSASSTKENSWSCSASKALRRRSIPPPAPSKASMSIVTGISKPWPW